MRKSTRKKIASSDTPAEKPAEKPKREFKRKPRTPAAKKKPDTANDSTNIVDFFGLGE